VDDYVGPETPIRFIEAFVAKLDLETMGSIRAKAKATGRPGYAPADLLKLYIYGYLNRVRSSRPLEAETHRNIEVTWLLRHLKPDFKAIADFRRDNRAAFKLVFRQFVILCRELDLFGRELCRRRINSARFSSLVIWLSVIKGLNVTRKCFDANLQADVKHGIDTIPIFDSLAKSLPESSLVIGSEYFMPLCFRCLNSCHV